jgi:hypothetical protein
MLTIHTPSSTKLKNPWSYTPLHISSCCAQGQCYVYKTLHSTHAYSESQNLLRRVVNEQVTEGKNSAHVANQSSLDRRSFAGHKSTGGLRATKWYSEAHTGPSVFQEP